MKQPKDPEKQNDFLVTQRARQVSQILADAARVARFSSRSRSSAQSSGYTARRGDKLLGIIKTASLILILILPNIISVLYFGLIASDQYVSEAKFTVSSGAIPKMDGIGSISGLPSAAIFQDSNIIINYIESRALIDLLDREINLREKYGSDKIDWLSRFNKNKSVDKLLEYWKDHVTATITAPAGIIKLQVSAFSALEAKIIADVVIVKCEALVNKLNDKMRRDTISVAESELVKSGERLKNIRIKIEKLRNQQGIINTTEKSTSFEKLLVDLEGNLLKTMNDYEIGKKYVSETAPQLKVLKAKIEALSNQIAEIKSKLTTNNNLSHNADINATEESVLSKKIREFSEVELHQKIAESSYLQASSVLELSRQISEKQLIYLHQITQPTLAEEASYPRRKLNLIVLLTVSFIVFIILNRLAHFIRDHLA